MPGGGGEVPWWAPPLLSVQFLTRIPVPALRGLAVEQVRAGMPRSVVWSPLVGGLIGGFTGGAVLLADRLWPALVAVALALAAEALLTGALHEDAVADFCDAFGGGLTRQRTLEIMKDSRVGSYGALALTLAVLLRAALLLALVAGDADAYTWGAVVVAAAVGRWASVVVMAWVPPVPVAEGLAKDIGVQVGGRSLVASSVLVLPFVVVAAVVEPIHAAVGLVLVALFLAWFRALLMRRLGGVTGDCLGFSVYAVQLIALLAATATPN